MTMSPADVGEAARLPDVTRQDRARFVKEARRLRQEQIDRLLRRFVRRWHGLAPRHDGLSGGLVR